MVINSHWSLATMRSLTHGHRCRTQWRARSMSGLCGCQNFSRWEPLGDQSLIKQSAELKFMENEIIFFCPKRSASWTSMTIVESGLFSEFEQAKCTQPIMIGTKNLFKAPCESFASSEAFIQWYSTLSQSRRHNLFELVWMILHAYWWDRSERWLFEERPSKRPSKARDAKQEKVLKIVTYLDFLSKAIVVCQHPGYLSHKRAMI